MNKFLVVDPNDNVMIALDDFKKGETLNGIILLDDVNLGHKIALKDILENEDVIKYNAPIGHAKNLIKKGSHVHVHNVKTNLSDVKEYTYTPQFEKLIAKKETRMVNVYERKSGNIGIRNELWIVPTVGCVNAQAQNIINGFIKKYGNEGIDGVYTFPHPYGCSQMGDDHINTRSSLQNLVKHPNAGGVLVLGLGCENNQVSSFKETLGNYDEKRVKFLVSQEVNDEVAVGIEILKELYDIMKNDQRVERPISDVKVGLKCGGSDGLSGITANPLIGRFSDYITLNGGTSVLAEVPEMFGSEHILMRRAESKEVFNKIVNLINGFKNYFKKYDQVIYENPSPGNKNGGITTLEDKSLGCTQKAGNGNVMDVVPEMGLLTKNGLNLLSTPGNDIVATTSLGLVGCQLVLFSTGRGTPFGGFIPTIKISSNSILANTKSNWIDFDAGRLINGVSMDKLTDEFVDLIVEVINGKKTKNEINGFREIGIFKTGVTL